MPGRYTGNLKMVALAGLWERVLFLEHYLITSPNAMSIHYFETKTLKHKKDIRITKEKWSYKKYKIIDKMARVSPYLSKLLIM